MEEGPMQESQMEEGPQGRHIYGASEDEIWGQLQADLVDQNLFQYTAVIHQGKHLIVFDLDIDPGGGFEGGYAFTSLTAAFHNPTGFRFALHREHFIDEVGKFFGMQDIQIGDEEFDKSIIIRATDEARIRDLVTHGILADPAARESLLGLYSFTFEIVLLDSASEGGDGSNANLKLVIEEAIVDANRLRPLYDAFLRTLDQLQSSL